MTLDGGNQGREGPYHVDQISTLRMLVTMQMRLLDTLLVPSCLQREAYVWPGSHTEQLLVGKHQDLQGTIESMEYHGMIRTEPPLRWS